MTYGTALKHAGIEVTEEGETLLHGIWGKTKSGKTFHLCRACGAYGMKFTLRIAGEIKATACIFSTAVRLIKTN